MNTLNFADLDLSPEILKAVADLGFEQASPIQSAAIPILMEGHDVVGQSQTGSGKTAAFAIPAIEICAAQDRMVQVLIMCPTRELAMQVADEVHKLSVHKRGIHAVPIYGGASYERQFHELKKGVQIVIGTPGRIMDHMQRGTLRLEAVKMVVLDEADRMLDMGFREDIEHILKATPKERQTVFFSATVSKPIRDLIDRNSREPKSVKIEQKTLTVPAIEQWYFEVPLRNKREALLRLVDFHGFKLGIVFCNTQRMVDELADDLVAQGISADRLHGGLSQTQRTRVMNKFKQAEFEFLVATDVAARGIDVDDLELVVNYDLPYDAEDYVHRIGRTGRAGRKGLAATFVTGRDIYKIQHLERFTRTKIQRGKLPTANEVEERRLESVFDQIREVLERGALSMAPVDRLLEEGYNSTDIAAALFELLTPGSAKTEEFAETKPNKRDKEDRSEKREDFSSPTLRPPSRGMRWVMLNVGREERVSPRDIIGLLEDSLGLPPRSVGIIEIKPGQSFAQVPQQFLDVLRDGPREIETNAAPVKVSLFDMERPEKKKRKKD
ncbi:MAG: DEAD/DEAH box helicase [Verrucomicrobia bacterium]|nr:DEAD/DEAH box helicase [Verrucomicrobiota bacterium]